MPVQPFSFTVITQIALDRGETPEIIGDQRVACTIDLTVHFKDASVQGLANIVVASAVVRVRQRGETVGQVGGRHAWRRLQSHRLVQRSDGLIVGAALRQHFSEGKSGFRKRGMLRR